MKWWKRHKRGASGGEVRGGVRGPDREVALPRGMLALLTPFPVVPWRDMVAVQEANLGWVCT